MAIGTNRGGPNPFAVINQMIDKGTKIKDLKVNTNANQQPKKVSVASVVSQPKNIMKAVSTVINPVQSLSNTVVKNTTNTLLGKEQPKQQIDNTNTIVNVLRDFQADVNKTTDLNKLANAYPELPRSIIGDLYSDFKKPGVTFDKIRKAYPELGAIRSTESTISNDTTGSRYDAVNSISENDTNIFGIPKVARFDNISDGADETTAFGVINTFGKNVVKSGFNLVSDTVNFLADPVDSAKALGQLGAGVGTNIYETITDKKVAGRWGEQGDKASAVGQFFVDRYGNMNNISKTAYTDPFGMFSDAVSVIGGGTWVAGKATATAGKLGTVTKLGNASKLNSLQKAGNILEDIGKTMMKYDPADAITNGTYKGTAYMARKIGDLGTEPAKIVKAVVQKSLNDMSKKMGSMGSIGENISKKIDNINLDGFSGLSPQELKMIKENPFQKEYWETTRKTIDEVGQPTKLKELKTQPLQSVVDYLYETVTQKVSEFSFAGPLYEELRKINIDIDISPALSKVDDILNNNGIKVKSDGTRDISNSPFTDTEANAIKNLYERAFTNPITDVSGVLNLRKFASKLARYDLGVSSDAQRVMKSIRSAVDDVAKSQIPQLKKLDGQYSKIVEELEQLKEGVFYKNGQRVNDLKDNIQSIMELLNNPSRQQLKNRLLEFMPDISERIQAINNLPTLAKLYTEKPNFSKTIKSITGSGIVGGALGFMGGGITGAIMSTVGSAIIGYFGDMFLKKIRAKSIKNILSDLSPEGLDKLSEIGKKIEDNKALQKADIEFMQQLKRNILREQEKYNKKPALPYKPMELTQEGVIRMGGKPITPNTALGSLKKQVIELPPARTLNKYNIPQPESLEDLKYFVETKRKSQELTEKLKSIVDENNMLSELGEERVKQLTEWNKKTQSELTSLLDNGELSKTDIEELISFKEKNIKLQETVHNEIKEVLGMEKAYEKAPLDMVEVEQLTIKQLKDKMNEKARINVHEKIGDERAENAYVHANKTNSEIKQLYKDGKLTKQDIEDIILARQSNKMDDYLDRGIASSSESELSLSNFLDEITPKSLHEEARKYKTAEEFIEKAGRSLQNKLPREYTLSKISDVPEGYRKVERGPFEGTYTKGGIAHDDVIYATDLIDGKFYKIKQNFTPEEKINKLRKIREEANKGVDDVLFDEYIPPITDLDITSEIMQDIYRAIEDGSYKDINTLFERLDRKSVKSKLSQETINAIEKVKEEVYNMDSYQKAFFEEQSKKILLDDNYYKKYEEFKKEVLKIEAIEQRIGKVGKNKVNSEYSDIQMRDREKKKERLIERIGEEFNIDQFEASDMYDSMI